MQFHPDDLRDLEAAAAHGQQDYDPGGYAAAERNRHAGNAAQRQSLRIRRKALEQAVLDDDGEAEGHEERWKDIAALNPEIQPPDYRLKVGQTIKLPSK